MLDSHSPEKFNYYHVEGGETLALIKNYEQRHLLPFVKKAHVFANSVEANLLQVTHDFGEILRIEDACFFNGRAPKGWVRNSFRDAVTPDKRLYIGRERAEELREIFTPIFGLHARSNSTKTLPLNSSAQYTKADNGAYLLRVFKEQDQKSFELSGCQQISLNEVRACCSDLDPDFNRFIPPELKSYPFGIRPKDKASAESYWADKQFAHSKAKYQFNEANFPPITKPGYLELAFDKIFEHPFFGV